MAKEPAQRYASAHEALSALDAFSAEPIQEAPIEMALPQMTTPSLLKSIVRSFSSVIRRPENVEPLDGEEDLLLPLHDDSEQQQPLTQELLLYASTEDVVAAIESERRRMAVHLKNDVIEPLNLLLSQAGTYEKTLGANQMAHMAVSVLSTLARQVLQQVRDLDDNLQPIMLGTLGLEPALEIVLAQPE